MALPKKFEQKRSEVFQKNMSSAALKTRFSDDDIIIYSKKYTNSKNFVSGRDQTRALSPHPRVKVALFLCLIWF